MSTTLVNQAAAQAPAAQPVPVHPPLPFGLGSYVTLTGAAGAVASFIISWYDTTPHWHMNPSTAALGVASIAAIAAWFAGRSHQAAALISRGVTVLHSAGVDVSPTPRP